MLTLFSACAHSQGKRLLRQWFLQPVVQLEVLADRHDTIELLLDAPSTNDALRAAMKQVGLECGYVPGLLMSCAYQGESGRLVRGRQHI
jgi:DNA mismatch repair ATPase MutS